MALANAVQNAAHTPQRITWTDTDDDPLDLTGATLTGRIRDVATGVTRDITGTLAIVTAAAGLFSWTYSATDVGTAGAFVVQFTADYDAADDKTLIYSWTVHPSL